tara:strand:- start:1331 stop:1807 length:477 start_codon:yes stop_codon:yes gene_type:complete
MAVNLEPILNKLGHDLIQEMVQQISSEGKTASKDLINSFSMQVEDNILQIFNAQEYSGNVDLGRRPGKRPPVEKIMKWLDDKKLRGRSRATGRFIRKRDAAYVIAKKIGDYGYPGINYVSKSIKTLNTYIIDSLGEEYIKELNEMLKDNISRFEIKTE